MRSTLLASVALSSTAAAQAWATDIHGHRGARGLLPENTLPAFEKAIELGVDILELDTGLTSDGVVVVSHDRSLDPDLARRDGAWIESPILIRSLTLDGLRKFDVGRARPGSRAVRRFPDQEAVDGTPVPTLEEVFALAARRGPATLRFNIETKISPLAPEETAAPEAFATALVQEIQRAGLEDRVIVQSFDWRTLAVVKSIAPTLRTAHLTAEQRWLDNVERGRDGASPWLGGLDVDDHGGSVPRTIKAAGGDIWSPYHKDLADSDLAEAHALGIEVHVWTVNDTDDIKALADRGVDGIITDYPDRAIDILRR